MFHLIGVLVFGLGAVVGLGLPDMDATLPFLTHRSIVTHHFLWPLLPLWAARDHPTLVTRARLFSMGLSLSLAVHFCFDLFPRSWRGYALIHIPLYGRTEALFSWVWLALCVLVCVYLALRLMKQGFELALLAGGGLVSVGVMATAEPFGWPLVTLVVSIIVVTAIDWERMIRPLTR